MSLKLKYFSSQLSIASSVSIEKSKKTIEKTFTFGDTWRFFNYNIFICSFHCVPYAIF